MIVQQIESTLQNPREVYLSITWAEPATGALRLNYDNFNKAAQGIDELNKLLTPTGTHHINIKPTEKDDVYDIEITSGDLDYTITIYGVTFLNFAINELKNYNQPDIGLKVGKFGKINLDSADAQVRFTYHFDFDSPAAKSPDDGFGV